MVDPEPTGESRPFEAGVEPADGLLKTVVLESVQGPFFGFFVAAYVVATRRGYYAYGKLCRGKPDSVWDVGHTYAKLAIGPRSDAAIAMDEVFRAAEAKLSRKPFNRPTMPSSLHADLD
jgi:hypothetical protein